MRICFYYEYKNLIGGLTTLLITLIKELKRQGADVVLFNYPDGIIANELKQYHVDVTIIDIDAFDWDELNTVIDSNDVLVATGFIEAFYRFLKINPKLLYYNINDYLSDVSNYKFGIKPRFLAKKLIQKLLSKNALVLMDDTAIRGSAVELGFTIKEPLFLPIPVVVPAENQYLKSANHNNGVIRLTYIGRSVDWKMYPLKKILDDLNQVSIESKKIVFSIVVDSIKNLASFIDIEKYKSKKGCEIILYENIKPSEINKFLLENADLNFGMGTSTLEGGKLGIPSILMDFSTKDLPATYRYNWLYNAKFFSLGHNVETQYTAPDKATTLATLISNFLYDENYKTAQSKATYNYVKQHHGVENIATALLQYSKKTSFRLRMAKPYVLYYSLFHQQLKRALKTISK